MNKLTSEIKFQDFTNRVADYERSNWSSSFMTHSLDQLLEVTAIFKLLSTLYNDKYFPKPLCPDENLRVLDAGCACGYTSRIWAPLSSEVYGFDLSVSGITIAQEKWKHLKNATFFVGNGIFPTKIQELQDKTFDLILFREFLPFCRFLTVEGTPLNHIDILQEYLHFLAPGGICIIWHHLDRKVWDTEGLLNFSQVKSTFPNTYGPINIELFFPFSRYFILRAGAVIANRTLGFSTLKQYKLISESIWALSSKPNKLIVISK